MVEEVFYSADVVGSQDSDHAGGLLVPLPDKFTYSTIIKGYCARGEMEQSLQMFDSRE